MGAAANGLRRNKQQAFNWVVRLGAPGLFAVSLVDASIVPLVIPGSTDLLLIWLIGHGGSPWLLGLCALAGSLVGGWTTWRLGKEGGEKAIERYVPPRFQKRVSEWAKHRPLLVVYLPAMLPPPIPLWPFLLAAGALGATWKRFLAAFGAGRTLRYGLDCWLAYVYGRQFMKLWSSTLNRWEPVILWSFVSLTAFGIAWGILKLRRFNRQNRSGSLRPSPAR